jgi:hypothetical protein
LRAYDRALAELIGADAVLPARFGSMFEADSEVRELLRDRQAELTDALARVRGAVELGVRASWPASLDETAPAGAGAGTAYMLRRLELDRRARQLAADLDAGLGDLARAANSRILTRPSQPVTASYLVDHERIDRFRERVHELDVGIEEAELVCTGPWPPYSFVGREGS